MPKLTKIILSLTFLTFSISSFAISSFGDSDDLLRADEAFILATPVIKDGRIEATWKIADGYYLYDDKFKFKSPTEGIAFNDAIKPDGKIKKDPNFGDVEIHRNSISISIPLKSTAGASELVFDTVYQGCADLGVCYPPQKKSLTLALADTGSDILTPGSSSSASSSVGVLNNLRNSLGIDEPELLPADQAFAFEPVVSGKTIVGQWRVADGYYLYKNKIKLKLKETSATLADPAYPEAIIQNDPIYGETETYRGNLTLQFPLANGEKIPEDAMLYAEFQGCADVGVCYPPIKKNIKLASLSSIDGLITEVVADSASRISQTETATKQNPTAGLPSAPVNNAANNTEIPQNNFDKIISEGSLLKISLAALGFGLLLAFTACMYPMIPILSSIIVGQGEKVTMAKGFTLSLVYVLALAVTFGIVGALTATFFKNVGIQAYLQSPWLLIPFVLLFIALSLSMFGFFDIQIPSSLQTKLNAISNRQKGGNLIGVAIMGALSALIIGPCGGPVLVAAMGYAAASGDVINGFIALFALGLGMGLPLLLVGIGGGTLLPKAGNWMSTVKATGGVILLAVALVFLERMPGIFPTTLVMMLWAALIIVSGVYMGAFDQIQADRSKWFRLWKGLGLFMVLYGMLVMLGGLTGGSKATDPLHNSSLFSAGTAVKQRAYIKVKTVDDLNREVQKANSQGKTAMLDFYADWCVYCKTFDQYVFPDPRVQAALSNTVLLKADVTKTDKQDTLLMKHVSVMYPPAILFFDTSGNEMKQLRVIGGMNADQFSSHISGKL